MTKVFVEQPTVTATYKATEIPTATAMDPPPATPPLTQYAGLPRQKCLSRGTSLFNPKPQKHLKTKNI